MDDETPATSSGADVSHEPITTTVLPSSTSLPMSASDTITKFTNCRLLRSFPSTSSHTTVTYKLVKEDLWISSLTGTILDGQEVFYTQQRKPDLVIDCHDKILSPGLIDLQLNGAFGINFSDVPSIEGGSKEDIGKEYERLLKEVNRRLVPTGVTSYLPTLTSQRAEVYHQLLRHLGPSEGRRPEDGGESLGAHIEGPFLSKTKAGIHAPSTLRTALKGYEDLDECYGEGWERYGAMITAAPEEGIIPLIPNIVNKGLVYSIGHSEATYEEAQEAVAAGATMITHLFNAMRPLHHRNPGVFGVLGSTDLYSSTAPPSPTSGNGVAASSNSKIAGPGNQRPFYGLISDGVHLHPTTIKIAYSSHPSGCVLVTDAMHIVGLPDGLYSWGASSTTKLLKRGSKLTLEGEETIAGSAAGLMECLNNFLCWTGVGFAAALGTVTGNPARVLGIENKKGSLINGGDADLVILGEVESERGTELVVEEVWKFGVRVWKAGNSEIE